MAASQFGCTGPVRRIRRTATCEMAVWLTACESPDGRLQLRVVKSATNAGLRRTCDTTTLMARCDSCGLDGRRVGLDHFGSHCGVWRGQQRCDNYSPDIDACDEAQSLAEYGRLYNWYAVDDARGLCPSGWHVPTDGEWTVLEEFMSCTRLERYDEGTALKSTYGWY